MKQTKVVVRCPNCGKRLFDVAIDSTAHAVVTIPCKRCGTMASIEVAHPIKSYYATNQEQVEVPASIEP